MAVRSKKGGYEVYWRDPATGRQRGRLFRTKAEAEKENRRIKRLLQFDREALILEDVRAGIDGYDFMSVWDRYRASFWDGMVKQDRILFRRVLTRIGGIDVRRFTTASFIDVSTWLRGAGWKYRSIQRAFTAVNKLLRFAEELGLIQTVPRPCRLPYEKPPEFIPPNEEELSAMYAAACPHLKRVIILCARFGMRVGPCEAFSLRWRDVDLGSWVIRLRAAKKNREVGIRTLPIPESYRELFLGWRREDGDGAETVVNYRGDMVKSVEASWAGMLKRAGITRRIRPYDLRHAFATNMLEAGVDIGTVAKLMGHSSTLMITKHYQYVREERKLDALSRIGPIV